MAQSRADLEANVAALQHKLDDVGTSYDRAKADYDNSLAAYTATATTLQSFQAAIASRIMVINTVIKFPKKADLLSYLRNNSGKTSTSAPSELPPLKGHVPLRFVSLVRMQDQGSSDPSLEQLQQDFTEGKAGRIREVNPYNDTSYTRYYDKNGDWQYGEMKDDYGMTQKLSDQWTSSYERAKQNVDVLGKQYDQLQNQFGQLPAIQSDIAGQLQQAQERLNQFSPQPQPRPTAEPPGRGGWKFGDPAF
jgi:hypothetical protein